MLTKTTWIPPRILALLVEELAVLGSETTRSENTERRIGELRDTMLRAEVTIKPDDGIVEPGMRVTVRYAGESDPAVMIFGEPELVALDTSVQVGVCAPGSLLGRALEGTSVGDRVTFSDESGSVVSLRVLAAVPWS